MPFAGSAGNRIESGASDLDPAAEDASPRLSGGRRREAAAAGGERRRDSPASSILGSEAQVEAREALMCSAQGGEANGDDGCGGEAAERRDDAAARP
jgi:hypothetical protein